MVRQPQKVVNGEGRGVEGVAGMIEDRASESRLSSALSGFMHRSEVLRTPSTPAFREPCHMLGSQGSPNHFERAQWRRKDRSAFP